MAENLHDALGGTGSDPSTCDDSRGFMEGGGEMGTTIRAYAWHSSVMGEPESWPQTLKSTMRLLLNSRHPMFIWWGSDLIQFYNDAYGQLLGPERHPGALGQAGRNCWEQIWPITGRQIDTVMRGEGATWHKNALVPMTRNGVQEDVCWTYSYTPIDEPAAASGVGGVLVVCSETTASMSAQQRFAGELYNLRRLFLHAPGAIAVLVGRAHRFELVNAAYRQLVGGRDLVGRTVAEAIPEVVGQGFVELLNSVYDSGVLHIGKGVPIVLSGPAAGQHEQRIVDFVYQPVFSEEGEVMGIFAQITDTTQQRLAENRLHDLNIKLERLTEQKTWERDKAWNHSHDIMLILSTEGTLRAINPAWTANFGYPAEESIGHSLLQFVAPEDTLKTLRGLQTAVRQSDLVDFRNRLLHKDGSMRWIAWHTAMEDDLVFAYGRDITLEQQQVEALAQAAGQIRQSQKMEAIGQLTGGIAHDFNNLLTGISGSLALLEAQATKGLADTGTIFKYTAVAQGAAKRAAALTHRLLAFSRMQTLTPGVTDINTLISGMSELVGRTVGPAIHIQVDPGNDLWPVLVDHNQLENALLNLCINARDAMPDGGTLRMAAENIQVDEATAAQLAITAGDYVQLRVDDTGVGMSADVALRAFDPFFTTKPLGEGTGLGLSMVYGFARQSDGQIKLTSQLGEGTQVAVYLPRYRGESEQQVSAARRPSTLLGQHAAAGVSVGVSAGGSGDETVLLVDDDEGVRLFVSEVLIEKGCRVIQASIGSEGLEILRSNEKIDLLITDVGLPGGMNGRQVADAARQLRPDLKVLFITGYAENAVWQDGKPPLGMEVLIKPFEMDELEERVERLLHARQQPCGLPSEDATSFVAAFASRYWAPGVF